MHFLQPFTYKKINRNNIYRKTDYSIYKARNGRKSKL